MLFALVLALFILQQQPVQAHMACDTATEQRIQDTVNEEPSKLIAILDGHDLSTFLTNLTNRGYLVGSLEFIDRIYIVDAGKLQGYTTDNVWLFFIEDGCLIRSIPAMKSIVVEMLP